LKTAGDPFDPTTERQILVALAVLAALAVWRLEGVRREKKPEGNT
jgi:MYXO-CTERM domain-containing protein